MKSAFIGIIGRPNVGKSTLLNAILGEKVAIATDKPQTTRNRIRGIYTRLEGTDRDCQLVFIDTPGIHNPRNKLGSYMTETALNTIREVDAVLFLVDGPLDGAGNRPIVELLAETETPRLLVINKIDKLEPEEYKTIYEEYRATGVFEDIFGTCARTGRNVPALLERVEALAAEGPMYFPEDMVTDHPERFLVGELIREKALLYLQEEVPHGVAVEIESYQEEERLTRIGAVIYCEKKSHKGIIIGKEGKKLKGIGKSARLEIEGLLGTKVFLELFVKVRENWRNSEAAMASLGYKE
ncbi:MAG: GTPase Era [Bacillota bacterium]|nr:GTPase Era [Bacillota bacterium]